MTCSMRSTRLVLIGGIIVMLGACGKSGESPTAPSTPTSTKSLTWNGNLAFGAVTAGTIATSQLTLTANGTDSVYVSDIQVPAGFAINPTTAFLNPGESRAYTVSFEPTAVQPYGGNIALTSDQTGGSKTSAVSGSGTIPAGAHFLAGTISAGSDPCTFDFGTSGVCVVFPVTFHAAGRVDARLTWNGDNGLLDLEFVDASNKQIVRGDLTFDPFPLKQEHSTMSTFINPGTYKFYARGISLSKITDFFIVASYPD
jgi:hypothetical protein